MRRSRPRRALGGAVAFALGCGGVLGAGAPARAAYPSNVVVSCSLQLTAFLAEQEFANTATFEVASGTGTPTGRAIFTLIDGVTVSTVSVGLTAGVATFQLPRSLPGGTTYLVNAQYRPGVGTTYKSCTGGVRTYTVQQPARDDSGDVRAPTLPRAAALFALR